MVQDLELRRGRGPCRRPPQGRDLLGQLPPPLVDLGLEPLARRAAGEHDPAVQLARGRDRGEQRPGALVAFAGLAQPRLRQPGLLVALLRARLLPGDDGTHPLAQGLAQLAFRPLVVDAGGPGPAQPVGRRHQPGERLAVGLRLAQHPVEQLALRLGREAALELERGREHLLDPGLGRGPGLGGAGQEIVLLGQARAVDGAQDALKQGRQARRGVPGLDRRAQLGAGGGEGLRGRVDLGQHGLALRPCQARLGPAGDQLPEGLPVAGELAGEFVRQGLVGGVAQMPLQAQGLREQPVGDRVQGLRVLLVAAREEARHGHLAPARLLEDDMGRAHQAARLLGRRPGPGAPLPAGLELVALAGLELHGPVAQGLGRVLDHPLGRASGGIARDIGGEALPILGEAAGELVQRRPRQVAGRGRAQALDPRRRRFQRLARAVRGGGLAGQREPLEILVRPAQHAEHVIALAGRVGPARDEEQAAHADPGHEQREREDEAEAQGDPPADAEPHHGIDAGDHGPPRLLRRPFET